MRRNNKTKQPIDRRSLLIGRTAEDSNAFTVIRMVHQRHLDSGVFAIRCAPVVRSKKGPYTFWERLAEALGAYATGMTQDVQIHGEPRGTVIRFRNKGNKEYEIDMNGYFDLYDVDLYDQISFRFTLELGRVTGVTLFVADAFDKGLNRELEEYFTFADPTMDFEWLKLEYLLDYLLTGSRALAREEECLGNATIEIGPPDCREQYMFLQWEWFDQDRIQLELIGTKHARPRLTKHDVQRLVKLGWVAPNNDEIPNFLFTFERAQTREIAAFCIKSIRTAYDIRPTDPVFVEPFELLELLAPKNNREARMRKFQKRGIEVEKDILIHEKWLRGR